MIESSFQPPVEPDTPEKTTRETEQEKNPFENLGYLPEETARKIQAAVDHSGFDIYVVGGYIYKDGTHKDIDYLVTYEDELTYWYNHNEKSDWNRSTGPRLPIGPDGQFIDLIWYELNERAGYIHFKPHTPPHFRKNDPGHFGTSTRRYNDTKDIDFGYWYTIQYD